MIINEIFYSLQGEGGLAGAPSVFIRLAGCRLRCRWCDTKYAWSQSAGREYTIEELKEKIISCPARHVVITGGEPMTNTELAGLLDSLVEDNMHITIETSGIKFLPSLPCDLMSISPKLSNSTPINSREAAEHEKIRFNPADLQKLIDNYEYQLKFVVESSADLDEIIECLEELEDVDSGKVFLMPQVTKQEEYPAKMQMAADLCKRSGFRLSSRLQILLWNNQKGSGTNPQ